MVLLAQQNTYTRTYKVLRDAFWVNYNKISERYNFSMC